MQLYSKTHIPSNRPNNLNKRTMCMNHTNKIECRQNKNNKTATTISPLEWAKENLEFKLSFSTSLSLSIYLTRSVSVFGFSYDFLAVASTLALIQSPLIHIEPLTCTDTPLVVEYTHRTKSLLCVFFFILFSVVRLCMPYLFSVEPESTEIRTDIVSFNRTLARNCCFIKSLSTFSFIELIRKIFHTKKIYINFLDFQSDYSGLFLKIVSKFVC